MGKRTIGHEAKQEWLRQAALATEDVCVDWPWGRDGDGYGSLRVDGKQRGVHILVCEMVHGPRPEGMQAAHRCGRTQCCSATHLRWATAKENAEDKRTHRTEVLGERNGRAVLGADDVRSIRVRHDSGAASRQELADEYGLSYSAIERAVKRRSWAHLD